MKEYYIKIFWFVTPCRLENNFLRFGGTYYLHFQGQADPIDRGKVKGRTGSLHLGPCIRALCSPHRNSSLLSSPEALRTSRRERPLLAREGN
jgi:hypothetical protein